MSTFNTSFWAVHTQTSLWNFTRSLISRSRTLLATPKRFTWMDSSQVASQSLALLEWTTGTVARLLTIAELRLVEAEAEKLQPKPEMSPRLKSRAWLMYSPSPKISESSLPSSGTIHTSVLFGSTSGESNKLTCSIYEPFFAAHMPYIINKFLL